MNDITAYPHSWNSYVLHYFAIGVVALALLKLWALVYQRKLRAEQKRLADLIEAELQITTWQSTAVKWLRNTGLVLLTLLLWPATVPGLIYEIVKGPPRYKEPESENAFECKREHLLKKTTIEIAEACSYVTDPKGRVPDLPFGHLNDGWCRFKEQRSPGYELWSFEIPGFTPKEKTNVPWVRSYGYIKGYAWVNKKKVKAEFFTEWDGTH